MVWIMDGQRVSSVCTLAIHHRESNGERGSKNPTIFSPVLYFVRLCTSHSEKYIVRPGCITSTPQFHNSQPRHRTFTAPYWSGIGGTCAHTYSLYVVHVPHMASFHHPLWLLCYLRLRRYTVYLSLSSFLHRYGYKFS